MVNELGFRFFKENHEGRKLTNRKVKEIWEVVRTYILRITRSEDTIIREPISKGELSEALEIANSLALFFSGNGEGSLTFWPEFPGCGIIHQCKGDILQGRRLVEVKAGDRTFRLTDLRQVLTYCCLDFASKKYDLLDIVLINPRRGLFHETLITKLVTECSGTTAVDFFSNMIEFISSEEPSR
ncbi:MAG: hypothetical protein AB1491_04410 [Thermodesulfobacteriota bacterium]